MNEIEAHEGMSLQFFLDKAHAISMSKGFWDEGVGNRNLAEMVALMHSELSELLEAIREEKMPRSEKIPDFSLEEEECADLFIRLADYCRARGVRLERAVIAKMNYNMGRPHKHGKRF